MIDAAEAARLLRRTPGVDEFTITERRRVRASRVLGERGGDQLADTRELHCVVYRDLREGRGAQPVSLGDLDRDGAREVLRRAADAAARTHGPPWRLPLPAAPARVSVADPALGDPAGAADELAARLAAALPRGARLAGAAVEVEAVTTEVRTSTGFGNRYQATCARWRASVAAGSAPVSGDGAARRLADLHLGRQLDALAARAGRRTEPLAPGRYDLVLRVGAIAPLSPTWAWFSPIAHQASGELVRRGLTRYRSGQSIFAGEASGDLLDIASDGTIDHGLLSAPFSQQGEPVRRFALVRAGRAADLALDLREAGLRDAAANGGVRNLDVGAGTHDSAALLSPGQRPLAIVDDLAWLEIDTRGRLVAGLGSSEVPGAGFRRGGALAGDAFALLGRARLSRKRAQRGWYRGPALLRLDDVSIA